MVMHTRVWQAIELHGEHDQAVPGAAAEVTARATALLEVTFLNSAVDCVGEAIARRTKCKQLGDARADTSTSRTLCADVCLQAWRGSIRIQGDHMMRT